MITKSWKVTLVSFVIALAMPIVNEPLAELGILITEQELTHFLYLLFGVSGIGATTSILKRHESRKEKQVTQTAQTNGLAFTPPILRGTWYKNNFLKHEIKGNTIPYGTAYLWAQIVGAKRYVTGVLRDANGTVLQIEQGGHKGNPLIDTVRLELFDKAGNPLPRGKYSLQIQGDRATSDSTGIREDAFEIV